MSEHLDKLAKDAAGVLRDDPELELEVGRELCGHLEDRKAELLADGKPEAEAEDTARKAFGPLDEVAEGLLAANRRRMNLRGRARLLARFALVPLAVLVAGWMWWDMLDALRGAGLMRNLAGTGNSFFFFLGGGGDPESRLTKEQRFLLNGDESRPTKSARMRAIWERFPDKTAYYGNYLTYLASELDQVDLSFFEQEVRHGEKIDPGNSRYAVLLGLAFVTQATAWEQVAGSAEKRLVVKDRQLLARGMAELLRVPSLPLRYTSGGQEMCRDQLAALPSATFADQIGQVAVAAGMLMPDLGMFRNAVRVLPLYARQLAAEGRQDEAARVLRLWEPLAERLVEGSHTLIELLVAKAIAKMAREDLATCCDELGLKDLAQETRAKAGRLSEVLAEKKNKPDVDPVALGRRAGVLGDMLLPALGRFGTGLSSISEEALAVSRWKEYAVAERWMLGALVLVLFLLMGLSAIAGFAGRLFAGARPLLLLPPWGVSARILVYGVLAPLALYALWTRLLPWSGRDVNLSLRFLAEASVLLAVLAALPATLAGRWFGRRCRDLGVDRRAWRLATIARSLVPVYAAALILLALLCGPYLRGLERDLVRRDTLISPDASGGFTRIETEFVRKARADFQRAFVEIRADPAGNR